MAFLGKGVLKKCSKFTGEHPCRSVISIKLLWNFIEITLWYGGSPVNLLNIFRTSFHKNNYEGLLRKKSEINQVPSSIFRFLTYAVCWGKIIDGNIFLRFKARVFDNIFASTWSKRIGLQFSMCLLSLFFFL